MAALAVGGSCSFLYTRTIQIRAKAIFKIVCLAATHGGTAVHEEGLADGSVVVVEVGLGGGVHGVMKQMLIRLHRGRVIFKMEGELLGVIGLI